MSLSAALDAIIPFADVAPALRALNPLYLVARNTLAAELGLGDPPAAPAEPNEYGTTCFVIAMQGGGYWRGLSGGQNGPLEFAAHFYAAVDAQRVVDGQLLAGSVEPVEAVPPTSLTAEADDEQAE